MHPLAYAHRRHPARPAAQVSATAEGSGLDYLKFCRVVETHTFTASSLDPAIRSATLPAQPLGYMYP